MSEEPKVIVRSESGDWYLIPHEKLEDWEEYFSTAESEVDWADYIGSPEFVLITSYELT